MQTATLEPTRIRMADLEILEAQQSSIMPASIPAAPREKRLPPMTKRDLRQQFLGVARMINHLSGGDMREQIDNLDFMVRHIDLLEEEKTQLERDNAELRKALSAICTVLEGHEDPFEVKPPSKWKKVEADKWMLAAGESIKWVMQRAENALEPVNAVPIAADPE